MVNTSILAAFERMWQHVVAALGGKADINHNHSADDIGAIPKYWAEKDESGMVTDGGLVDGNTFYLGYWDENSEQGGMSTFISHENISISYGDNIWSQLDKHGLSVQGEGCTLGVNSDGTMTFANDTGYVSISEVSGDLYLENEDSTYKLYHEGNLTPTNIGAPTVDEMNAAIEAIPAPDMSQYYTKAEVDAAIAAAIEAAFANIARAEGAEF